MGTQILLLLLAAVLIAAVKGKDIIKEYRAFRAWRAGDFAAAMPDAAPEASLESPADPYIVVDGRILPGAGTALLNPPADLRAALSYIAGRTSRPYTFPLGWRAHRDGSPECVNASFIGDVNHALLTGFTDSGKDSWAAQALLAMAQVTPADRLQLAILDGKGGLSWIGWGQKQHVWFLAKHPEDIRPAMDRLKSERERRQQVLERAGCEKWDEYEGGDMPLIVAFVSELMLLQAAVGKNELADWLNTELSGARASGIRYIVSSQTVTRLDTRWRSQIGLYVAGYQPREDADEPNTSFSTKDLQRFGTNAEGAVVGVPPSALPVPPAGAGVFTCIQGRTVVTVRASYLTKEHRTWLLGRLPDRPAAAVSTPAASDDQALLALLHSGQPLPISEEVGSGAIAQQNAAKPLVALRSDPAAVSVKTPDLDLVVAADIVPAEEQARILAAAQRATSRRQIAVDLYSATGGQKYNWVKFVCDAAGLLPVQGVAQ